MGKKTKISPYLLLFLPFILLLILNYFMPFPVQDEKIFWSVVKDFGKHFFPTLEQIKYLPSPMGPIYFIFWGFLGKLCGFNTLILRAINIVMGYAVVLLIYELYRKYLKATQLFNTFWYMSNPYFILFTVPFLYTDCLNLVWIFLGVNFSFVKDNKWLAGIFWALAVCTRQFSLLFPAAYFIMQILSEKKFKNIKISNYLPVLIPAVCFSALFILWGFSFTSGQHPGGAFTENTIEAFKFSLKAWNYFFVLCGIYLLPYFYRLIDRQIFKKYSLWFIGTLLITLSVLVVLNEHSKSIAQVFNTAAFGYHKLPKNSNMVPWSKYLEQLFIAVKILAFVFIPVLAAGLANVVTKIFHTKNSLPKRLTGFSFIITLVLLKVGFPRLVNSGSFYKQEIAGYADRFIIILDKNAYVLVPMLFLLALIYLLPLYLRKSVNKLETFSKILLFLFILLESVYTYAWDKHFLPYLPFLFLINSQLFRKEVSG